MATLTQLSYALALAEHGSFVRAARSVHVTQPTLSMQLQKLEEELGLVLFDRSRKPVVPTDAGLRVVHQARLVIREMQRIEEIAHEETHVVAGPYSLGVIPTLASTMLPLFLMDFVRAFPKVELTVKELTTERIVAELKEGRLDSGLMATPLGDTGLNEHPLFFEPFRLYHAAGLKLGSGKVALDSLPLDRILLMAEGHCLRTQVVDLCHLTPEIEKARGFAFATGSIETLIRMVDQGEAFTVLPELAVRQLTADKIKAQIKELAGATPYREVSLVTYRSEVRSAITKAISAAVSKALPKELKQRPGRNASLVDPV